MNRDKGVMIAARNFLNVSDDDTNKFSQCVACQRNIPGLLKEEGSWKRCN